MRRGHNAPAPAPLRTWLRLGPKREDRMLLVTDDVARLVLAGERRTEEVMAARAAQTAQKRALELDGQ